jgi:hypothetical protein
MKPSRRILLLGIFLELMLAGLGWYLLTQIATGGMKTVTSAAEASQTIGSVIGMVMGGLGGLLLVIYFLLKRRGS